MRNGVIVLVEGESDRAAVATLFRRLGIGVARPEIVAMGGATNVARHVAALHEQGRRAIGLCDAGEERFFARALDTYFVCNADLEDEFIRALGVDAVERVIEREGDLAAFRVFQNQPAQRSRPVEHQLRRFLGTTSGRKIRYGTALADALDLRQLPGPLAALTDAVSVRDDRLGILHVIGGSVT
jgi:hypothetical protein